MTHDTEHITDPGVFRLHVGVTPRAVVFAWDYPGSTLLEVRIQRSDVRFASEPYQGSGHDKHDDDQDVVYDGDAGSFRDEDVEPGQRYFYTVWARPQPQDPRPRDLRPGHLDAMGDVPPDPGGWVFWARRRVKAGEVPRLRLLLARLLGRA
jgi:hypothetical protein